MNFITPIPERSFHFKTVLILKGFLLTPNLASYLPFVYSKLNVQDKYILKIRLNLLHSLGYVAKDIDFRLFTIWVFVFSWTTLR